MSRPGGHHFATKPPIDSDALARRLRLHNLPQVGVPSTLHNIIRLNSPLGISCLQITSPRVSRSLYARNTLDRTHILGYLTSSGPESLSSQPTNSGSSFASSDGRKNVSGFKIMTVTRGFTEEADKLLDYLVSSVGYISSSE